MSGPGQPAARWPWLALASGVLLGSALAQAPSAPAPPAEPAAKIERQPSEDQASLADGLYRRGQYRMAAGEYAVLLRDYPAYARAAEAYLLWADCHRQLREFDQAEQLYRKLLQQHPDQPAAQRALIGLVDLLLDQQRAAEAQTLLQSVDEAKLQPAVREAVWYFHGTLANQQNDRAKALEWFARLPRNEFGAEQPYRPYAQLASALILRANKQPDQAAPLLERLVKAEAVPGEVRQEAQFYLGDLHFTAGDYESAAADYAALLATYPDSSYAVQARLNQGWSLLQLGRHAEVLKLFEEAPPKPLTTSGEELYLRAAAAKELQQYETALAIQRQLVKDFPQSEFRPYAEVGVVECLYYLKQYDEAVKEGTAALQREGAQPFALELHQFLGQCYLALGRHAEAAASYETLLSKFWGQLTDQRALLLNLADIYRQAQQFGSAAATYRRLLQLPDTATHPEALLLAAEAELQGKAYDRAFADYERLARDFPQHAAAASAVYGMAEAKTQAGLPQEALPLLNRFLTDYPGHALRGNALYLRGSIQFRLGQSKEAIADLAASLQEASFTEKDFARLFLGYALWEEGKEAEALQLFAELLQKPAMDSSFTPAMLKAIARGFIARNNLAVAERCYELLSRQSDAGDRADGAIGLARTTFLRGDFAGANAKLEQLRRDLPPGSDRLVVVLAYLGETYRLLGQEDRALVVFQEGLKQGTTDTTANALLRLGMARVFQRQQNAEQALRYATSAFVLFDDAQYSSEAMWLTCRMLLEGKRLDEARLTFTELDGRFPLFVTKLRADTANQPLLDQLK